MWRNVGYAKNKLYTSEDQYELCDIIAYFSSCANMNIYGMKLSEAEDIYYNLQKKKRKKKKLLWCTSATARITAVSLIIVFTAT